MNLSFQSYISNCLTGNYTINWKVYTEELQGVALERYMINDNFFPPIFTFCLFTISTCLNSTHFSRTSSNAIFFFSLFFQCSNFFLSNVILPYLRFPWRKTGILHSATSHEIPSFLQYLHQSLYHI